MRLSLLAHFPQCIQSHKAATEIQGNLKSYFENLLRNCRFYEFLILLSSLVFCELKKSKLTTKILMHLRQPTYQKISYDSYDLSVPHRPPQFNTSVSYKDHTFSAQKPLSSTPEPLSSSPPSVPHHAQFHNPLSSTPKIPQLNTKNLSVPHFLHFHTPLSSEGFLMLN